MAMFGLEGRYDIWRTPLEVGLGFSYALPLNMKLEGAYRYWSLYASLDCKLNLLEFRVGKNLAQPYIGVAVGGGQSFGEGKESHANVAIRADLTSVIFVSSSSNISILTRHEAHIGA